MKLTKENIKIWLVQNFKWIILFICTIVFLAILENTWGQEIMREDIIGYNLISRFLISDTITPIAKVITNMGSAFFLITVSAILLVTIKNKKIGISITLNLITIAGLNLLLKNIVQRPRPTDFRLIDESGYSFPSGHSMVSMAFYGFLIYLAYKYIKNNKLKMLLSIVLGLIPLLIGISRIYLGVHYTSDVIGGFMVSISYLIIYTRIVKKFIIEEQ